MPAEHQVLTPIAVQVEGNSASGAVHLFYRMPDSSTVAIALTPDMLERTLRNLVACVASSPNAAAASRAQLLGIRNVTAQVAHGALVTLRYELELGVTLETSIEPSEAEALASQLSAAASSVPSSVAPSKH